MMMKLKQYWTMVILWVLAILTIFQQLCISTQNSWDKTVHWHNAAVNYCSTMAMISRIILRMHLKTSQRQPRPTTLTYIHCPTSNNIKRYTPS